MKHLYWSVTYKRLSSVQCTFLTGNTYYPECGKAWKEARGNYLMRKVAQAIYAVGLWECICKEDNYRRLPRASLIWYELCIKKCWQRNHCVAYGVSNGRTNLKPLLPGVPYLRILLCLPFLYIFWCYTM